MLCGASLVVGNADWSEAVDVNCGAAAIYTPVDRGFPDNGILAIGVLNRTQWVYAELDFNAIEQVRQTGQVFNYKDWPKQFDCRLAPHCQAILVKSFPRIVYSR